MLNELTKKDWLSMLGLTEDQIPQALILRGTRNLKEQYKHHRQLFENVSDLTTPNGVLEDIFIGELEGRKVGYASVYGAPMACEVVHAFGALGTKLVVQTGCCGGLDPTMKPGDLVVVGDVVCGEGASMYYSDKSVIEAHTEKPQLEPTTNWVVHYGRLYTTSALFAQSRELLDDWHEHGCIAADMETAATFAVAEHFEMQRASLLYVFDCPRADTHVMSEDAELDQRRSEANDFMIQKVFELIKKTF
jgi:uridine phosphorylase